MPEDQREGDSYSKLLNQETELTYWSRGAKFLIWLELALNVPR